jgi:RNA polymerase sigma factor (sigma-70 family)
VDEPDFSALYQRYAQSVYRFALYLSGDFALAQDLTADTFARAWIARDRIRVGSVNAYLLMIARNLYRDEKRRRAPVTLPDGMDVIDNGARPAASVEARDELRRVLAALRQIPDGEREVLLMATVEGLSHQAIAGALELSVEAVKVRVHRGRVRLNAILAAQEGHHVNHARSHP